MNDISDRLDSYRRQVEEMRSERDSFTSHWKTLGEYILPRRPRFFMSDANKGDRRTQNIIDSTATQAMRTLSSGMVAGMTSPARPWFRLTVPYPDLMEREAVKVWLHVVTNRMRDMLLKSNVYNSLPVVYADLGCFATAAVLLEEDFETVLRSYVFPIGSYMIANSEKGKVEVFAREFRMTVRQIVGRFCPKDEKGNIDFSAVSESVKQSWEDGSRERWVDVVHIIQPNEDYKDGSPLKTEKKYSSCYYEVGASDKFLSDGGYDYFPVLCPRWEVTGEDVYGTNCPGMTTLSDIKQLQVMEKRSLMALNKMVDPPMSAPTQLRTQKASLLPGDITFVDVREGQQGFRPVHEVSVNLYDLDRKEQEVRMRIKRGMFEDLFLQFVQTDRREITAREIDERHEEKMLVLGPVLEQLNQDMLDPLIDICFALMLRQGLIPEPPEELQGIELKVEYVSVMAQAQKLLGITSMERMAMFVGQLAQYDPTVLDKLDRDQLIDEYAEVTGVPPRIIVSDENVAIVRAQRAQQMAAQQQAELAATGAKAAKDLSKADTEGDNGLTRLMKLAQAGQLVEGS